MGIAEYTALESKSGNRAAQKAGARELLHDRVGPNQKRIAALIFAAGARSRAAGATTAAVAARRSIS